MNMSIVKVLLLVAALICFICGAANFPVKVNPVALGLAFWVLSLLLT